jgi:hypothetical protein
VRQLLSGALAALSIVAALGFRRFAKRSQDRFFDYFSVAFLLLALNSVALGLTRPNAEGTLPLYALRLAAFTVILVAIWDKNRR